MTSTSQIGPTENIVTNIDITDHFKVIFWKEHVVCDIAEGETVVQDFTKENHFWNTACQERNFFAFIWNWWEVSHGVQLNSHTENPSSHYRTHRLSFFSRISQGSRFNELCYQADSQSTYVITNYRKIGKYCRIGSDELVNQHTTLMEKLEIEAEDRNMPRFMQFQRNQPSR